MKVSGGLVGITLNTSARNKFFLVYPHLSRLAEEAKQFQSTPKSQGKHNESYPHVQQRQERQVSALTDTLRTNENPFTIESNRLFNILTKKVVPEKVGYKKINATMPSLERK